MEIYSTDNSTEINPNDIFMCGMVAANGDPIILPRFGRDLDNWLTYNSAFRPGYALYVDGKYVEPVDSEYHTHHDKFLSEILSLTEQANEKFKVSPIPTDWHLSEGRYYPPGADFVSTGSYMLDHIADRDSGPIKF